MTLRTKENVKMESFGASYGSANSRNKTTMSAIRIGVSALRIAVRIALRISIVAMRIGVSALSQTKPQVLGNDQNRVFRG